MPTSDKTLIVFPMLESWNSTTKMATIAASVDKKRVLCRISLDILMDNFGATEEVPMRSVAEYRHNIQDVAKQLIESERYEEDGSILIRACDL